MKKKIAYILTTAAIGIAAFLIGRDTVVTTVDTEPEVYSGNVNEYYAYKSEDIYGDNDNHYINMESITDYTATEDGLQFYLSDGTGYWIEK